MTSTATTRLRLQKQGTGDNNNTWGTTVNGAVIDLLDTAIAGMTNFTLSGTKTLSSTNYAADEARAIFLNVTSGTGGTVTIPAVEKAYIVRNNTSGTIIVTTGSGTTATIQSGDTNWCACDATNTYLSMPSNFGSVVPSSSGTPTNSTDLVTKSYADSLAFSSSLPSQTGNSGKFITTDGNTASWGTVSLSTITGTLAAVSGGTGQSSYATGDILYASSSSALSKLADVATGNALISGGVGAAPSWSKITLTAHVSGTLPVANGGTGVTSSTGSGNNVLSASPTLTGTAAFAAATFSGQVQAGDGTGSAPGYSFTSDTNTGMWRVGADNIGITCGGTTVLSLTSTSVSVGVGLTLTPSTPASAAAAGTAGQIAVDANFIYVCTAPNTWKRAAISTW